MKRLLELFTLDWGDARTYDPELRRQELAGRLHWFVSLRWIGTACCVILAAAAYSGWLPLHIDYRILTVAALFLALTNLAYSLLSRRLRLDPGHAAEVRLLVIAQTFTDYVTLTLVTYATGGFEFPVLAFFLCEITLITLFCRPIVSFVLTLFGVFFAVLPLVLEHLGVVPALSLFDSPYKELAVASPSYTAIYITAISLSFLFFWYLVTEISVSLRQGERNLEKAQEKMILLDREKTYATLRATHELKAPLAAINSYVFTLRDGYCGELPEKALQVLERIRTRADLLMNKIVDIIHLSNLKTFAVDSPELTRIDLTEIVAQEVREAAMLGQDRRIRIVAPSPDAPPYPVCGVKEQLHSLFSNILRNALTYSHEGGAVEVSLVGKRDRVSVIVEDQGIGIPAANLKRIFDEHFRSNNAVQHNPNGTGLGLSIVREIARVHHALVGVASEEGKGTRFTLTFRLLKPGTT